MQPESFWQELLPAEASVSGGFPARLPDGRILVLPVRRLPDGSGALASLIINQASFAVLDALACCLAQQLAAFAPQIIVGVPTLGLTLAAAVARQMGFARYVPLGTSAKFWYREELSVPLSSVTTPSQQKRLYIDPRMLPLLDGRRVAVIDDVISSGASMRAAVDLLAQCSVRPVALGAAMLQSDRWRLPLSGWPLVAVLHSPLLPIALANGADD